MSDDGLHRPGLRWWLWPVRQRRSAAPACPDCQTAMEPAESLYDPVLGPLMGPHVRRHVCPACHASRVLAAGSGRPGRNPVATAPGALPAGYGMRPSGHR